MQAMVAGLNAIVWERDPVTWGFRFVNARAEEVLGYPVEEWLDDPPLLGWIARNEISLRDGELSA